MQITAKPFSGLTDINAAVYEMVKFQKVRQKKRWQWPHVAFNIDGDKNEKNFSFNNSVFFFLPYPCFSSLSFSSSPSPLLLLLFPNTDHQSYFFHQLTIFDSSKKNFFPFLINPRWLKPQKNKNEGKAKKINREKKAILKWWLKVTK